MERVRVTFMLDGDQLDRLDGELEFFNYRSRAHLIEVAVLDFLDALEAQDQEEEE